MHFLWADGCNYICDRIYIAVDAAELFSWFSFSISKVNLSIASFFVAPDRMHQGSIKCNLQGVRIDSSLSVSEYTDKLILWPGWVSVSSKLLEKAEWTQLAFALNL